ncbi:MAG: ribonuclease P protein component [Bacteroidales bacterium]
MQTLQKSERLGNFRLQQLLFRKGRVVFCHPFRVVYLLVGKNTQSLPPEIPRHAFSRPATFLHPAKALFSVPSRHLRRATDRNRVKRLMKEAYRKNKTGFYSFLESRHEVCVFAFIYVHRHVLPYGEVESKIKLSLQKLRQAIEESGEPVS